MLLRSSIRAVTILLFITVIAGAFTYGPSKRSFITPSRTVEVKSTPEIEDIWNSFDIHGRIAVIFAGHLNLLSLGSSFPDGSYLDSALRHGRIRTVYYIVPDSFWPTIEKLSMIPKILIIPLKPTDTGFIMLHEGGRIYLIPLSKYIPEQEKALVVIEPAVWNPQERSRIEGFIGSGQLASDLIVLVSDVK